MKLFKGIKNFFSWFGREVATMNEKQQKAMEDYHNKMNEFEIQRRNLKCPKCDSKNLKILKPSDTQKAMDAWGWPFKQQRKNLNVCRDCGFSWEDR